MDVFLSYNDGDADRKAQEAVSKRLRAEGHRPLSINLRTTFEENVISGLQSFPWSIEFFVVFVSKKFMESAWHHREVAAFLAYESDRRLQGSMIVPVRVESDAHHWIMDDHPCAADFQAQGVDKACESLLGHLRGVPRPKPKVFVAMKLNDPQLDDAYDLAIARAIEHAGYEPKRIDQNEDSGNVPLQILEEIEKSKIVLADFTYQRRNCYFEAGFAMGLGKEVILTVNENIDPAVRDEELKASFDIAGNRFIQWKTPHQLLEQLNARFAKIAERDPTPQQLAEQANRTGKAYQAFRYQALEDVAALAMKNKKPD